MVVFCLDMVREIRDDFESLMFLISHRVYIFAAKCELCHQYYYYLLFEFC